MIEFSHVLKESMNLHSLFRNCCRLQRILQCNDWGGLWWISWGRNGFSRYSTKYHTMTILDMFDIMISLNEDLMRDLQERRQARQSAPMISTGPMSQPASWEGWQHSRCRFLACFISNIYIHIYITMSKALLCRLWSYFLFLV